MVATDYVLNMDRVRGRFSITIITLEDLMIAKLEGWPDIKSRYCKQYKSDTALIY